MTGAGCSGDWGRRPFEVATVVVGVAVTSDGPKPQTVQAPEPCGFLRVQRGQVQRCCSSELLSLRIWLRSGFCRGASQMEQRGAAPAFRKVQRPHDHSLPCTTAAMEPGE
ncbi:hypothetical protein DPEC_G00355710 [Dallia pectoralis]|uniref:Uncharacterized protein n=1 Tax=Dallia pectoralis TaxID=75939 RepID=A0ACC2EZV8_DALPE|nr:hypothetical protein DPEC_G00355710 [Dallia pectoralis]